MESTGNNRIETLIQQGYSLNIGQSFSRGWEIFQKNIGGFVLYTLVLVLIGAAFSAFPDRLKTVGSIISLVITGPLAAGPLIVAFKIMKGQATTFGDFFRGFDRFLPLFLAYLVTSIFIAIGFILFVIPGVYLAVAYMFTIALIVERKLDFWEAMEGSRRLITKNWFTFFGLGLLLMLLNFGGLLLLGVGLLVTAPVSQCVLAAAYESVVGLNSSSNLPATDTLTDSM